ncbi:hypothetical protein QCA50_013619 [Cerrena zonata]|uniref:Fe2OG dioxygenase domain-containing protein n=1 Tax=Cerrena zonata TaxID=2478898 RepID=A0AAW0FVJ9_9APHY
MSDSLGQNTTAASAKRKLSASSSTGTPLSSPSIKQIPKKPKISGNTETTGSEEPILRFLPCERIRTARLIKNALDDNPGFPSFAYDIFAIREHENSFLDSFDTWDKEELNDVLNDDESGFKVLRSLSDDMISHAENLRKISDKCHTYVSGQQFSCPDRLEITRPGCEYHWKDRHYPDLARIFEHAAISGFGNVHTQETEFDPNVRNAREIPASEFSVDPKLIAEIEKCWGSFFLPANIRAVPYKIHLYGPGGQFRSHKDTPEKDLIGTFLYGLGDTTEPPDRFEIAGEHLSARYGSGVVFYTDVPHAVNAIEKGFRAVIAFKIFHREKTTKAVTKDSVCDKLKLAIRKSLVALKPPFAIGLRHEYHLDVKQHSSFDHMLVEVARSLPDVDVHVIPVFVQNSCATNADEPEANRVWAMVYPLTETHLDFILGDKLALERDPSIQWLKNLGGEIPLFRMGIYDLWSLQHTEGPGYTGNESRNWDQYSIYMHYAMVVVPKDGSVNVDTPSQDSVGVPDVCNPVSHD